MNNPVQKSGQAIRKLRAAGVLPTPDAVLAVMEAACGGNAAGDDLARPACAANSILRRMTAFAGDAPSGEKAAAG